MLVVYVGFGCGGWIVLWIGLGYCEHLACSILVEHIYESWWVMMYKLDLMWLLFLFDLEDSSIGVDVAP
jgi:hypothetical protein